MFIFSNSGLRRVTLAMLLACLPLAAVPADEEDDEDEGYEVHTTLDEVRDLQALGARAAELGVPILLMFASVDCDYCERLEAEVLGPMRLAGEDPRRVLLRKVILESARPVRDFDGQSLGVEQLAARRGVGMVPTLYLLAPDGRELVPKIVGYTSPDFYPAYLDSAIDVARELMRRSKGR